MCDNATAIVNLLDRLGVPFARTAEGRIDFRVEPPSEYHRTAYAGDETGRQIHRVLCDQVRRWETEGRIIKHDYCEVLDFIVDKRGICRGLVTLDLKSMEVSTKAYDAVVLAVGGPLAAYGESRVVADDFGPMISAYMRGAKWVEPHSFLWEPETEECLKVEEPSGNLESKGGFISIPFAKRHLGGLLVDEGYRANIPNLFAVGEGAYLSEGRAILPGNELLMDIHSGLECASSVESYTKADYEPKEPDESLLERHRADVEGRLINIGLAEGDVISEPGGDETPVAFYRQLAGLMQRAVGPLRSRESLKEADTILWGDIHPHFLELRPSDRVKYANRDIPFVHKLGLLITACETIVRAASVDSSGEAGFTIIARWSDEGPVIEA
jgi:succinate dehydrogenase/fumarate reductase flavoprotein subunit